MATKFQYLDSGDTGNFGLDSSWWAIQTFTTVIAHILTSIKVKLYRYNEAQTGTINVSIRATSGGEPTGNDLATGTLDVSTITTTSPGQMYEIILSGSVSLDINTKYAIVLKGDDVVGTVYWRQTGYGDGAYAGGQLGASNDQGSSWTMYTADALFECWGGPVEDMAATGGGLSTATAIITVGTAEGETFPDERPSIDPDKHWDEETGTWVSGIVGLGRHKISVIAIGQGNADEGVVYFGDI